MASHPHLHGHSHLVVALIACAFVTCSLISALLLGFSHSPIAAAMSRDPHWDCWCTQLCSHGPGHTSSRDEPCRFAHSLGELRAPIEIRFRYDHYWREQQVDRFYGQDLSQRQIERFKHYWDTGPRDDRPSWAVGLRLLLKRQECTQGMAHSWDFGLSLDLEVLRSLRNYDHSAPRLPFMYYEDLWPRLRRRQAAMNRDDGVYMKSIGCLGVNPPPPMPPQHYPLGPPPFPERLARLPLALAQPADGVGTAAISTSVSDPIAPAAAAPAAAAPAAIFTAP